eukprot:SM000138S00043  [mRNA]  locus=s138:203310:204689:+ [translate_table: standard]
MLWAYLLAVAFFHLTEFGLAALYTPAELSRRFRATLMVLTGSAGGCLSVAAAWLISPAYVAAFSCSCLEYEVERRLAPSLKACFPVVQRLGAVLVVLGEVVRKAAFMTARHNFTHEIKHVRRPDHRLVIHGIYRYVRHPGYMGWFIWSIATQLMLANPLCTAAFACISWRFFSDRILYEEQLLRNFFGLAYDEYAILTPSGIPFVP